MTGLGGLAIVQSNQAETLRQVLIGHLRRNPLPVLADEVVLVQSAGIGRWLLLGLAAAAQPDGGGLGVAAGVRFELPARFLWQAYRAVLGESALPEHSLYDADRLRWLILRVLPECAGAAEGAPLAAYLARDPDDPRRRFRLAGKLAALFEAYQLYRADWLATWERGHDRIIRADGRAVPVPDQERWQPALWRRLIDVGGGADAKHRGRLHHAFVDALSRPGARIDALPGRVTVFGISALPQQVLDALSALAKHLQVLVCLHNPCRDFWGELETPQHGARRWRRRSGHDSSEAVDTGHPLLAGWGTQGRDFIRMLDRLDRPEHYAHWFNDGIDLFEAPSAGRRTLLAQIQQGILDCNPEPAPDAVSIAADDDSLRFGISWSRQREVEVLHDVLLDAFERDPTLQPRDVIVMVPDIAGYAAHVEAVFGQHADKPTDPRRIPYSIADLESLGQTGYLQALEKLLALPGSRVTASECLDLLKFRCVQGPAGFGEGDLELLDRWVREAGARWGFDADHRALLLGTDHAFEQNSWRFALDRMLLGYAAGEPLLTGPVLAYDEVSAGQGVLLGRLAELIGRLQAWSVALSRPATMPEWVARLRRLADECLRAEDEADQQARLSFEQALEELVSQVEAAGMSEPLALEVVRDALAAAWRSRGVSTRFLAGRVNFTTLMPMRAIPFRMVCLLGMGDGEYPRAHVVDDFDLLARFPRPGDRSRADDDRYLMLQALLSARERLYVSWVGRNIRDHTTIPPSVLVGQLRDFIAARWRLSGSPADTGGVALLQHLTRESPLQPFSRRYFTEDPDCEPTFAHEWASVWQPQAQQSGPAMLDTAIPDEAVDFGTLGKTFRLPVKALFEDRLASRVPGRDDLREVEDDEPVAIAGLAGWSITDELLGLLLDDEDALDTERAEALLERLRASGRLPPGPSGERDARESLKHAYSIARRYRESVQTLEAMDDVPVDLTVPVQAFGLDAELQLADRLTGLHRDGRQQWQRVVPTASQLGTPTNPKWPKVAAQWPAHVTACALGKPVHTVLIGADRTIAIAPLDAEAARAELEALAALLLLAWCRPIPVEAGLSCDYLKQRLANKAIQSIKRDARQKYEGPGFNGAPLVRRFPALARAYPDFDRFWGTPEDGFEFWSVQIYRRLFEHLRTGGDR
ncbi:MAG: exodeoxyribonuclease V subunit gamma [Wenzhouxiangellaceae bacterium]